MSTFNERYDEYKKKKGGDSFQSRYLKHKVDKGEIDIDAVGKDLSNRVNTWLDNNKKYFTEANTRFSGDNSVYRADASDWLNSATSRNSSFKTEADSIKKDLNYYAPLFGDEYIKSVLEALDGNLEAQKSILTAANSDLEYWSQWENEGAWKRDYEASLAQAEQNKADLAYDLVAGSSAIKQYEQDFANINSGIEQTQNTLAQLRVERATLTGRMDAKSKNRMSEIDRQIAACEKAISDAISQQGGINQAIEDEKKKYSSAERAQKSESYKALTKENDFVLNSQPISKYIGGESYNNFAGMYTDLGYADYEDLLHGYINGEPSARRVVSVNYGPEATLYGYDKSQLLEMTPEEVSIYNYVYNTEGKEAAKNYIDLIMSDLNARKRTKEQEYWAKEADQSPFLMSIFSVATSPLKTVSFVGQTADYIEDGAIDQNASYNKFSHINTTIRNEVSDKIEKNWGGVGSFAYQTGMSMADFLLNTAIAGGNSAFSLGIMGSSAAADTVISAKDRGLSDSQAYSLGIIAGAAEIITEKVSIEALLDKTTLGKNALEYVLKNVLSEGGEEVSSSVINLVADVLISKDKSEWQALVNKYTDQGMNEQKAFLRAVGDQAISLGVDFLGGAISGGVMGGGSVGINTAVNKFEQNRFTKSLGQDILDFGNKDALMELAKQVTDDRAVTRAAKKVENKATAKNVGNLSQKLLKNIAQSTAELETALVKEGLTKDEARLVAKYSMGEDLSEAEEKKVESNEKYIEAVNKVFAKKNKTLTTEAKSEITESEATANESNAEAESIRVRDGGERLGSENTERPILQMERGAGPYSQWRKALGTRPRDSQAARIVNKGREVTVASLGIAKGSNIHKVRLVDVENETDSMKKARKQAESRGLTVKFFVGGNLVIEEKTDDNIGKADEDKTYFEANGYINGNVMLVRADHYKFTADQIARHESGHDMIAKGEVDIKSVKKRLIEIVGGKENVDDISKLYAEAYEGTTLDGDEIFEELICDSLGDMNIFAYGEEAAELMALAIPEVQRAVKETKGEPNQTRGSPESEGKASRITKEGKASRELDTKYLSAVESGDIETAQKMVDEAAKEAGYKEHLYHGTNADFTKFDLRKHGGRNGKGEGYGIYLAANREISAPYGKNVIDSYVKFNRLAEGRKKTLSYNEVKSLVKRSCEIEAQGMVDDEEYDSVSEALRDTWVSNIVYTYDYSNISQVYADVANKLWKENDNDGDLINEIMALSGAHYDYNNALDFYDNILTPITGIDGFHYIWGNKDGSGEQNDIYLAFRSEQIKSADTVTYDDDGNVIPLSERFNEKNEDIRYSRELDYAYQIDALAEGSFDKKSNTHIKVSNHTPQIYIDKADAQDREIIMSWEVAYLAMNKSGDILGHYHGLGADVMKALPKALEDPLYIIKQKNGRIAAVTKIVVKGKRAVFASIDMDTFQTTIKNGVTDSSNYNLIVTVTDAQPNYLQNTILSGDVVYNKNQEDPADFILRLKSLKKLMPTYDPARSSITIIDDDFAKSNTFDENSSKIFGGKASRELDVITHMDAVAIAEGREMYEGKAPTDRERLANALESITENDIERKKLKEYKANIEKMNAETEKLKKLKAEIKELTFGKGKKDPQKLKTLRAEATKTENRINTYDKTLLNLEASSVLKGVLMREKQKAYKRAAEKGREALHKNVVGRNKTVMRHKIQDVAHRLDKLLNNATKERNVKKGQSELVRRVLDLTDLLFASDDDLLMNGIETEVTDAELDAINKYTALYNEYHSYDDAVTENKERRKELRSEMNEVKKAFEGVLERERKRISKAKSTDVFKALISEYEKIAQSKDEYIAHAFDQETKKYLEGLRDAVGDTLVKDMTLDQLEMVYKAFRMIETMVSKSNKMFNESLKATAEELGSKTLNEVLAHKRKTEFTQLGKAYSELSWNNLKPIYLMERIGSKTLQMLFDNVLSAESDWAKYEAEARKYSDEMKEKYGFKNWDFKKKWKFTTKTGLEFELDLGQIFTIYAYAQRGEQALNHLRVDGFVFDKLKVIKKNKLGIPIVYELNNKTAYKIDDYNLFKIVGNPFTGEKGILTDDQINYVVAMQKYLSEVLGKRGNEVSEQMYGIDLFNEENYLPIRSDDAYLERVREQAQGTPKIKNRAHTKPTVKGAHNPIVLSNFNEIWAEHVTSMNEYVAFTLPLEDFYKVYNYTNKSSKESDKQGVIPAIENAYSKAASKAINQLLTDLNGGTRTDSREGVGKALMGAFKKAKVMLSLSVVVQQPSSIIRAQAVIDPKYFVGKPDGKKHKEAWEELKKYAPVAIIKEMGYFDVGMGRSSIEWLNSEEYHGLKEKTKGFFKDGSYRDEVLSKLPALADEATWIAIWNAVKRETLHTHKDLAPNSEAFLEAAGKRFEEIIRLTQVYDSTLSRSANMRSKSAFMQMATAFLAEPTTSLNMREMALRSGDKARIARTTAAVYASSLLNAILVALPYAARDDDDDETFAEKYLSALTSSFVNNINPLTSIPFIKDVWSLAQGYSVGRSDMSLIDDFMNSMERLVKESIKEESDPKAIANAIVSLVGDFANFTGIPLKNLIREVKSIINFGKTISREINGMETTWNSIGDALEESFREETPIVGWLPKETKKEKIVEAIQKGDKTYIERFKSSYEDEKSFYSAVRSEVGDLYRGGKMNRHEVTKILKQYGGYEKDEADNEIYWLIKEWDYKKKYGKDAEYSKYTEWYEAVKTGRNIKTVINDYTSHGVDKKTLASQITKYYKPIYIGMSNSERARLKGYLLNAYSLLGYNRSEKSRDIDAWLKD